MLSWFEENNRFYLYLGIGCCCKFFSSLASLVLTSSVAEISLFYAITVSH